MTTLVDLQHGSLRATPTTSTSPAVTSWKFRPNAYLRATAVSSTVLGGSQLHGGVLTRDGILITQAVSSTTLTPHQVQDSQPLTMLATSSTTIIAAQTGRSIFAPLTSSSGNKPYATASASLRPLSGSAVGTILAAYYAYGVSQLAPILANGSGYTGETGRATATLRPLAALSSGHAGAGAARPYSKSSVSLEPIIGFSTDPGPGLAHVFDRYINELVYMLQDWSVNGDYNLAINDTVSHTDTSVFDRIVEALMNENVQVAITVTSNGTFMLVMAETVSLQDGLSPDAAYVTWVMNLTNNANSSYAGFQFDSMVKFNGRFLAAGPNGLYELKGDTDAGAPIISTIALGKTDFDSTFKKQVDGVYLGVDTPGELRVELRTDDGRARTYRAHATGSLRTRFVQPGKGMFSRYWQVSKITNPNGDDFTLDTTELVPLGTKRRR